ncbi:PcfB family protein [Adlercreutzia sp. ZJ473]|uniref:PcfB family protein n=1 Tax=Adlercreutzia sp. ZJ473 TaxID=2722822 RepID=UPI0015535A1D|nr:PcfB family protein [Adlercreutzia sp. ZJ473]
MQEEVDDRSVSFCATTTRTGSQMLLSVMRLWMYRNRGAKQASQKDKAPRPGKKTLRQLSADGAELSQIPIAKSGIADFGRIARRHQVTYALLKDKSKDPPQYLVYFHAKQAAQLEAAFKEYTALELDPDKRPSVVKRLREIAKSLPKDKARDHLREPERSR